MKTSPEKENRFKRNSGIAIFSFLLTFIFFILLTSEIILRASGYIPGNIKESQINLEDSLVVRHEYTVGEDGILKVSDSGRAMIQKYLNAPPDLFEKDQLAGQELEFTIEQVIRDFISLNSDSSIASEFAEHIRLLKKKNPDSLETHEKANLEYAGSPVNADGFKSIPFENFETPKKRILLLGDSFTWGLGAQPLFNSFADILSARGYVIYNAGIGATDPPQYEAVARQLVPKLKPDIVIVNICMANDQMGFARKVEPYHYTFHPMKGEWMNAYFDGCYRNAQESYALFRDLVKIPNRDKSPFNRLCSKTVLTTRLWMLLSKFGWVDDSRNYGCNVEWSTENPFTEMYIDSIQKICSEYGSRMIMALIPDNNELGEPTLREAQLNFKHTRYYLPESIIKTDYPENDVHFNNSGFRKYAAFLQALIDSAANE